jgi:hypothetical protein
MAKLKTLATISWLIAQHQQASNQMLDVKEFYTQILTGATELICLNQALQSIRAYFLTRSLKPSTGTAFDVL